MEKIRLALVGVWHVHTKMYLKSIEDIFGDKVEWLYVWEHDKERALPFCEQLNAKYTADLDEVLNDPAVDAVIIEAETNRHLDLISRAAEAGKPVYTDKVLTITTEDALKVKDVLVKTGVKFVVSHEVIPVGAYQYIKKLVDDGVIGKVVSMHFRRAHGGAKGQKVPKEREKVHMGLRPDWFLPEVAGGGALIDLGIHGVAILAYLCGKPKNISAFTHNFTGHETEDSATILVEFENGAIGTAHTDMVTSIIDNNIEILGTDGIITVQGMENRENMYINAVSMPECGRSMLPVPPEKFRTVAMNPVCKFIEFVMDEENHDQYLDGMGIDEGIMVVRMVEAAYESAAKGCIVAYGEE